jgi:single-stranded DNA-binding protein
MNYATFIVQIIEQPEQSFFKENISVAEVFVKFAPIQPKKSVEIFKISVWGNLADDLMKYYQVNDYVIIEGYISLRDNIHNDSFNLIKDKEVEISIFKIYPLILS